MLLVWNAIRIIEDGPVPGVQCFSVEVTANAAPSSEGPLFEYFSGSLCISDAGGNKTEMSGNLFDMITALAHELKNRLEASAQESGENRTPRVDYNPTDDQFRGSSPNVIGNLGGLDQESG